MKTVPVTSPGFDVLVFSAITNLMSRLCFAVSKPLSEKFAQLLKPKTSKHYLPEIVTMAMLEVAFEIQSFNAYAALDILQENHNELEDESQPNLEEKRIVEAMVYFLEGKAKGLILREILCSKRIPFSEMAFHQREKLLQTLEWLEKSRLIKSEDKDSWLCSLLGCDEQSIKQKIKEGRYIAKIVIDLEKSIPEQPVSAEFAFYHGLKSLYNVQKANYSMSFIRAFNDDYTKKLTQQLKNEKDSALYFELNSEKIQFRTLKILFVFEIWHFLLYVRNHECSRQPQLRLFYQKYYPHILSQSLNKKQDIGTKHRELLFKKYELIKFSIKSFYQNQLLKLSAKEFMQTYGVDEGVIFNHFQIGFSMLDALRGK